MDDRYVAVGRIKRAVGLKGEVLIKAYSTIESISIPGCLFLKNAPSYKRFDILRIRKKRGKEVVCLLDGITDRNGAEILIGLEVYQEKDLLPRQDQDEYYWYELKGMTVVDQDGAELGTIYSIIDAGAQDVMVIRDTSREMLIPMVDEFIKQIDTKNRRCLVNLPPGLKEATSTSFKKRSRK